MKSASVRRLTFAAAALPALLGAGTAVAKTPEQMMAKCRDRAHSVLRTRLPDVETKYEGQRVDGTHAVNGTAYVDGRAETFQCSFNKAGSRIIQFIVNQPSDGG
jgi:hypothetical protein